jgi:hypothetical protein
MRVELLIANLNGKFSRSQNYLSKRIPATGRRGHSLITPSLKGFAYLYPLLLYASAVWGSTIPIYRILFTEPSLSLLLSENRLGLSAMYDSGSL